MDSGRPADGVYDFRFLLCEGESEDDRLGTNSLSGVAVSAGLYVARLDFGEDVFDGGPRWLEMEVRTNCAPAFTKLAPRQEITATPYAIRAASAAHLSGPISAAQLATNVARLDVDAAFQGAVSATNFIGDGSGLTNVASPSAANTIYVQPSGNDATGLIGRLDRPFATVAEALRNAVNDSRVVLLPGTHEIASEYRGNGTPNRFRNRGNARHVLLRR